MPYDSHIFEPPGTAERYADPGIRARLGEALRGLAWSPAMRAAVAQRRDVALVLGPRLAPGSRP